MKNNNFLIYLYLYFLYIIIGKSYCNDIFKSDCQNNSTNYINNYINSYLSLELPPLDDNNFNYKNNSKFYPREETKAINPGHVEPILLYKETVYKFYVNPNNYNIENDLIIYIYPLDCEIQIIGEGKDIIIENISNYENDAFYLIIKKENLNKSIIIMNTLIN